MDSSLLRIFKRKKFVLTVLLICGSTFLIYTQLGRDNQRDWAPSPIVAAATGLESNQEVFSSNRLSRGSSNENSLKKAKKAAIPSNNGPNQASINNLPDAGDEVGVHFLPNRYSGSNGPKADSWGGAPDSAAAKKRVQKARPGFLEDHLPEPFDTSGNTEYHNQVGVEREAKASPIRSWGSNLNVGAIDQRMVAPQPIIGHQPYPSPALLSFDAGSSGQQPDLYIPKQRLFHLDLKGAPPKVEYVKKVLHTVARLGATGVLMEYEDMFPFSGPLASIAAGNHYSVEEVRQLLDTCERLGLDVIPLVQTFGHMEFILKLEEFAHLRDDPAMPDSICSCHNQTMALISMYVGQVMALHPNATYLHIGCDEVYHMGKCHPCGGAPQPGQAAALPRSAQGQKMPLKSGNIWAMSSGSDAWERSTIFVEHVKRVASHVVSKHGVKVLVWDDMLRNLLKDEMMPLKGLVEPMVWVYAPDVAYYAKHYVFVQLAEVFDTAWAASAFKGAHGSTLMVPPAAKHLDNNLNWLEVMRTEGPLFKQGFQGLALTGWQRYDHFSVLCEVLPAAIPSLALDLMAVTKGYFNTSLVDELMQSLSCQSFNSQFGGMQQQQQQQQQQQGVQQLDLDSEKDPFLWSGLEWCFFPGAEVFRLTRSVANVQDEVDKFLKKTRRDTGWSTDYSFRRNYTSPFRLTDLVEPDFNAVLYKVENLLPEASRALSSIFDRYTVSEWIEQRIYYPMYVKLAEVKADMDKAHGFRTWPKRPLEPLPELSDLGIGQGGQKLVFDTPAGQMGLPWQLPQLKSKQGLPMGLPQQQQQQGPAQPGQGRQPQQQPKPEVLSRSYSGVKLQTARPKRLVQMPDFYRNPKTVVIGA